MGILDDIFGIGGGSSTSYNVNNTFAGGFTSILAGGVTSTLAGGVTSTIQGGDRAVEVDAGLDNVRVGGGDEPLHTIGELRVPNVIETKSDVDLASRVDVEPLQVDLCVDVGLTKLPKTSIRQPYSSHLGLTWLGTELFGFDWTGCADTIVDELPDRPKVIDAGPHVPAPRQEPPKRHSAVVGREGRGLRIRLD